MRNQLFTAFFKAPLLISMLEFCSDCILSELTSRLLSILATVWGINFLDCFFLEQLTILQRSKAPRATELAMKPKSIGSSFSGQSLCFCSFLGQIVSFFGQLALLSIFSWQPCKSFYNSTFLLSVLFFLYLPSSICLSFYKPDSFELLSSLILT